MATTNSKFLVKNGLAVAGATGTIDVINTSGEWIGATGTLSGATGAAGANGASGIQGSSGVQGASGIQGASGVGVDGATGISGASGVASAAATGATGYSGVFYATNQIVIGATGWSSYASPLGASGSLMVAGPMAVANHITTPQLLVGNYTYTGLGATGATGTIIANNLKLVSGGFGSAIEFSDGSTLGTGIPNGYINGPISGHSLLIGATGVLNVGATGAAWIGSALFVGLQGATGVAWGATGSINASVYISAGSTGATGFIGSTGTITAPTGYFNNIYLGGVALTSGMTITDDTTTNSSFYPVLEDITSGSATTGKVSSTKLYFNPSTGTLNATVFNSLSDANKKQNIASIQDAVTTVNKLNGVSFEWKDNSLPSYGVIAQDIEEVLPELVNTDKDGVKSVNYNGIIGFLINAIKEQQVQIDELKEK